MTYPDKKGHFGEFGGKYVPETLMSMLEELEKQFVRLKKSKAFQKEFHFYLPWLNIPLSLSSLV